MAKDVSFGTEARDKMMQGVEILTKAVSSTLGPKGRNVVIEKAYGSPRVTKDGVTVAKSIELDDRLQNMGAQMVKEVSSKTNDVAGDGTTTATVLAHAITKEGLKNVAAGLNPMDLKRGIDKAVELVVEELKKNKRDVKTNSEIAQVGTISANSDSSIGDMIASAMDKVGKDGVITVEEAKGLETTLETTEGLQFDRGYLSPYFVTEQSRMKAELENPYILFHDKKLTSLQSILPVLEAVIGTNRPILIVAEDVEGEVLATLIVNKLKGALKVAAVKAPGFGDRRKAMLEDMAILTGGTVVSEETGMKLENVTLDMLGSAEKVVVTKDDTTVVGGNGSTENIQARISQLKAQAEDTDSEYDREKLEERVAKLSGGVAVIRVGGASEVEVKEKKDRIDDALHATKAAAEEGIVAGGGTALLFASRVLEGVKGDNTDQTVGISIVKRACEAPIRAIASNAGLDGVLVAGKLKEQDNPAWGFNAQNGEYCDMFEAGIVDPTLVVRSTLQNAGSVASLFLTTEASIFDIPEKDGKGQPQMADPGMMM